MIKLIVIVLALNMPFNLYPQQNEGIRLAAGALCLRLSPAGQVQSLRWPAQDAEYMPPGQPCSLLSLTIPGKTARLTTVTYDEPGNELRLSYNGAEIMATVKVGIKSTHLTFELTSIQGAAPARIDWGPFPTTIGQTVGETVGVVRDNHFALGLQGLNMQTPAAAERTDFGSRLHAYAIEQDGGVKGSKIALFGCPAAEALTTIGRIEVAEDLPHPMLDGQWTKVSRTAKLSYLILSFGESNLEPVLEFAKKGGFEYVYHIQPFLSWGHFKLNPAEFPEGNESMKRCVEKAARVGIRLGVHTLSGFITTNDPYVTPVPDPRLARWGSSKLTEHVDEKAGEIKISDPAPFRQHGHLFGAIVGEELVKYDAVSEKAPWRLLGCKRGACGTTAVSHEAGADIGSLVETAYGGVLPGIKNGMMNEMIDRIVDLFNQTGLRQISFDGLEGVCEYEHGANYASSLFVKRCFDAWRPEVISDASGLHHYTWHIHTRMNWGEPWGAAMREGMPDYRFRNQDYFERNLFPRMLGWFQFRLASGALESTTLDDLEWMLAKCAGFDAGFALSTGLDALKKNGQTPVCLEAVREWEKARLAGAFSMEQRQRLREPRGEFHLEATGAGHWSLWPVDISAPFECALDPTKTASSSWELTNRHAAQPLRFVLRVLPDTGGEGRKARVVRPRFIVNGQGVTFPVELESNQYLVCEGNLKSHVYAANWNVLQTVQLNSPLPVLLEGKQRIEFGGQAAEGSRPLVRVRFNTVGKPETVRPAPSG